ncbi:MAG: hypothetical protein HN341_09105 [Verrucomicrobia bacterium]|jgi:hypothetical protein|nr:hypothetical protein [Verrucomicrobiota bacterium]
MTIRRIRLKSLWIPPVLLLGVGAFVWPVLRGPEPCVGGREFSEVWGHLWAYWIFPHMLFVRNAWPLWIDIVNLPEGFALYPADPIHLVAVTLLRSVFSLVSAYNLLMAGTLLLTAWATYLLAYELCRVRLVAVWSGVMVSLSPYLRGSYIDNYTESMGVYWVALVLLNCAVNIRRPTIRRGVLGGLLFAGLFYTNLYYTVIGGVAYALAGGWAVVCEKRNRGFRAAVLALAPVCGMMLAIPGLLVFMHTEPGRATEGGTLVEFVQGATVPVEIPSHDTWTYAARIAAESANREADWFQSPGSADIASYLPPLPRTQLAHPKGLLCAVYPGLLAPLCLGAFLLIRRKRLGGFFLAAVAAWLLSLGVFPCWRGSPLFVWDGHPVPGPFYALLRVFPFVSDLTQTYRFSVIVILLSSCAVALVAAALWRRGGLGKCAGLLLMAVCFADALLLGAVPFPVPTVETEVNPAFEWIRGRQDKGMVIEWPCWQESAGCSGNVVPPERPQYHQTVHQHPMGPLTDAAGSVWGFIAPQFFSDLAGLTTQFNPPAILPLERGRPETGGVARMVELGYGYFVVHSWALPADERRAVRKYLLSRLGRPTIFVGEVDVYTLQESVSD